MTPHADADFHECNDLPTASDDEQTHARLRLGFGLLYAIPGIPLLYNGDELVPGGNDPDNRRGMPGAETTST